MAQVMDRLTLVRSGAHNNDHHETATNWVLCGRFGTPFGDYPAIGAVVAHETRLRGKLPPYVAIPRNPSFTWELGKSAFLGGRYESFKTGDPNEADFKVQDVSPAEPITAKRADRRKTLLQAVDGLAEAGRGQRPDRHLRRVPAAGRVDDPVERGPRRLRHRAGERPAARPLRPHHVRPELPAGPAADRARRALRHRQLRRLGPSRQDLREPRQEAAGVRPRLLGPDRGHARARPADRHAGRW